MSRGSSIDVLHLHNGPKLFTHIEAFVVDYDDTARQFVCTKNKVRLKRLKARFRRLAFPSVSTRAPLEEAGPGSGV